MHNLALPNTEGTGITIERRERENQQMRGEEQCDDVLCTQTRTDGCIH